MGIRIDGASDLINATDGSLTIEGQSINSTGIVTASGGFKVGTAATIHSTGQINSTNIIVSAGSSIGIGTDRPDTLLHVYKSGVHGGLHANSDAPLLVENNGNCVIDIASIHNGIGGVYFSDSGASGKGKIEYKHSDDYMTFQANGSERARIASTGNLLVGATAVEDWDGSRDHRIQVRGNTYQTAGISILDTQNDDNPCELLLGKSRGTGNTIVGSADDVGQIRWSANDGAGFHSIAYIRGSMDGTPGSDDLPSKLTFGTSADGGATVSERLRIDSSGRILFSNSNAITGGFGTHTWGPKTQILETQGAAIVRIQNSDTWGGTLHLAAANGTYASPTATASGDIAGAIYFHANDGTDFKNYVSGIEAIVADTVASNDTPGYLKFSTTADGTNSLTERLRITSAGDFGTGGVTPTTQSGRVFHLHAGANQQRFHMTNNTTGVSATDGFEIIVEEGANVRIRNFEAGNLMFDTGGTDNERMRIDSGGKFYYNTTSQGAHGSYFTINASDSSTNGLSVQGTTANYVYTSIAGGSTGDHVHFSNWSNSNTETGRIKDNQSNVTYYTSSDYRLKENIVSISDGITRVKQLNPVRHTWKNNAAVGTVDGWIAHELDAVCPDAVDGVKDAVNEDGSIDAQAADYGRITPLLAAALKEAITKIETLETKVAALESA